MVDQYLLNQILVPGYIPPAAGLYHPASYLFEARISSAEFQILPDRNLASRMARIAMGEPLEEAGAADLPAASYLREVIERVLADGQISYEECREVYRAVEAVLPLEVRRQATVARKEIDAAEREAEKASRRQAREARRRDVQIAATNLMMACVRHEVAAKSSRGKRTPVIPCA